MTAFPELQVTADGRWEAAEVVPLTGDPASARSVVTRVAQGADDDLAVEILWPGQAFVGVRWPVDLAEHVITAVHRVLAGTGVHTVEAGLLALLGTTPVTEVEFVELGAVNAWQSTGPERLWQRGTALAAQAIDAALARRPDLVTCPHPVAVELAVTTPQPCWVGVYVSKPSGPVHILDPQMLANVLDRV